MTSNACGPSPLRTLTFVVFFTRDAFSVLALLTGRGIAVVAR